MIKLQQQLTRNIFTSWAGYGLRIVISFFFVPYVTAVLGDARYGVWVIVFQTINYFVLLDFGLEKALVRFLSKYLSKDNFEQINRTLNTTFALYLGIGSVIIVGAWLTATFLFDYFDTGNSLLADEGKAALIIIGIYMGARFYLLPFSGSLGGFQRFDLANGLNMAEELLRVALLVWLLSEGYGLPALASAILGVSIVRQLLAIVLLRKLHPRVVINLRLCNRQTARDIFGYSKVTFGITLAWLVIFNTDTVLLGLMASTAAAGVYAPGAQLMLYLRNAVNAVATPLTAAVSHLEAAGDMDAIRRMYLKGVRYASYLSFFMATGVIVYARPFIKLWLEPQFAAAAEVMQILAVSGAFFIPQIIGNAVLFGIDKHRYLLRILQLEAMAKIVLALLLVKPYGLIGMAFAAAAPQFVLYVTMYPILIGRAVQFSPIRILMTSVSTGLQAMFFCLPAAILMRLWIDPADWTALAANVGIVTLMGIVGGYFVMEPADRARLHGWLSSSLPR